MTNQQNKFKHCESIYSRLRGLEMIEATFCCWRFNRVRIKTSVLLLVGLQAKTLKHYKSVLRAGRLPLWCYLHVSVTYDIYMALLLNQSWLTLTMLMWKQRTTMLGHLLDLDGWTFNWKRDMGQARDEKRWSEIAKLGPKRGQPHKTESKI